jgi:hypothetical protein
VAIPKPLIFGGKNKLTNAPKNVARTCSKIRINAGR